MQTLQRDRRHPNIAEFHTHWLSRFYDPQRREKSNSAPSQLHQLYEFYAHGTLLNLAQREETLNLRQLLQCLAQLLDGIAFVHAQRVLHLDLKPSNIFVADALCLKVGDFGISIDLEAAETSGSTKIVFSGDPIYIAPECLGLRRSLSDVGFAADIFALGIIALELLYDMRAPSQGPLFEALRNFVDFDTLEAMPQFKTHRTKNDSAADDELRALIAQMLQREAKDRPTAAQSLLSVIRLLSEDEFVQTLPGIDAIQLELVMSDIESTGTPSPTITPTTMRTPSNHCVSSSPAKPRLTPGQTAPTEFVQSSEKSFEDMAATKFSNALASKRERGRKPMKRKVITVTPRNSPTRKLNLVSPDPATKAGTPLKGRQRKSSSEQSSPLDSQRKARRNKTPLATFSEGRRSRRKPRCPRQNAAVKGSPSISTESAAFGGMLCFASLTPSPASGRGRSALQWDAEGDDDDGKKREDISESPSQSPSQRGQKLNLPFGPSEPSHAQRPSNGADRVRQQLSFTEPKDDEKRAETEEVLSRKESAVDSEACSGLAE